MQIQTTKMNFGCLIYTIVVLGMIVIGAFFLNDIT